MNANEPVMEMCDEGHHKFYKLPDHPKNSLGNAVCPYCLVIGRQRLEAEIEALKKEAALQRLSDFTQEAAKTLTDEEILDFINAFCTDMGDYWDLNETNAIPMIRAILRKAQEK